MRVQDWKRPPRSSSSVSCYHWQPSHTSPLAPIFPGGTFLHLAPTSVNELMLLLNIGQLCAHTGFAHFIRDWDLCSGTCLGLAPSSGAYWLDLKYEGKLLLSWGLRAVRSPLLWAAQHVWDAVCSCAWLTQRPSYCTPWRRAQCM